MTSFKWKKKREKRLLNNSFLENEDSDGGLQDDRNLGFKRKKLLLLEDCNIKSNRLVEEGIKIAECRRYWEAVKKWKEAASLTPDRGAIFEMTSQALMELGEVFPAVQAAERAVELDKNWWIAHQTLGRAQLGIGEIKMAVKSFSVAIHLNPSNADLRTEDLAWAVSLLDSSDPKGVKEIRQNV